MVRCELFDTQLILFVVKEYFASRELHLKANRLVEVNEMGLNESYVVVTSSFVLPISIIVLLASTFVMCTDSNLG